MATKRPWTEEDDAVLSGRFLAGEPVAAIAEALGRSASATEKRARELGLSREKLKPYRTLTESEEAYVRENHGTMTVHAMAKALGLAWETVDARLKEMGLSAKAADDNKWTDADVYKLRTMAAEGKSLEEMADVLDRTVNGVRIKARKLGVVTYQPGRKWSMEELDYLRRNWGYVNVSTIAKHVRREVDAVCQQAHKMRLGPVYGLSEEVSLAEFCRNTGLSRDRIIGTFVPSKGFPLKSRKYGKRQYYYFVDMDEALKWLERHQDLFDACGVADGFFILEPDWLRKKRTEDRADKSGLSPDARRRWWTTQEIDHVKLMLSMGKSYQEISERIGRSVPSIKAKMVAAGGGYTMKKFWKGREFKYVRENWETMSDADMAGHLGRSEGEVARQRQAMGFYRIRYLRGKELDFVRENWESMSDAQMADALHKSVSAVEQARYRMGLMRPKWNLWPAWDVTYLSDHWEKMTDAAIGEKLGRSEAAVGLMRRKLGLYRQSGRKPKP